MGVEFIRRPVSPLHFEPVAPSPEDILCYGADEETQAEREAKKQRIETLGKQYLQGRPLFILSASLRGPLHEGWKNPWAKRNQKNDETSQSRPPRAWRVVEDSVERKLAGHDRLVQGQSFDATTRSVITRASPLPKRPDQGQDFEGSLRPNPEIKSNWYPTINLKEIEDDRNAFPNRQVSELAPVEDKSRHRPKGWLKSDKQYFAKRARDKSSSPTPNHTLGNHGRIIENRLEQPREAAQYLSDGRRADLSHVTKRSRITRFSPPKKELERGIDREQSPGEAHHDAAKFAEPFRKSNTTVPEIPLSEADPNIRQHYYRASKPSKRATEQIYEREAQFQAKKLSEEGYPAACQTPLPFNSPLNVEANQSDGGSISASVGMGAQNVSQTCAQVPSLSRQRRDTDDGKPTNDSLLKEPSNARGKMNSKSVRRLSFTSSGKVKTSGHLTALPADPVSPHNCKRNKMPSHKSPSEASREGVIHSLSNGSSSHGVNAQPQRQIVSGESDLRGLVPSGPSTNLLETDKQSAQANNGEGDSYADLSTQAAMLKAQQSFQNEIVAPSNVSGKKPPHHRKEGNAVGISSDTPRRVSARFVSEGGVGGAGFVALKGHNPGEVAVEPISTQAMVEAMSPFAVTTVKKNKMTGIALSSPSIRDPIAMPPISSNRSPSMSAGLSSPTSLSRLPPPSNPLPPPSGGQTKPSSSSSFPSFSIAPDGMLTEVFQHDGQQVQPVQFVNDGWDLDAAIDEVGSFLGNWNVEAEARKGLKENKTASDEKGSVDSNSAKQSDFTSKSRGT